MATRRYEQRARAEAAQRTREQIVDTLYRRVRASPTERVSLGDLAADAGVARSTVYLAFGSRAGVFEALTERLLRTAGYDRIVAATTDPDARVHLRGGIEGSAQLYAEHRDVFRVLVSMSELDPDAVGPAVREAETRRAGGMVGVIEHLQADGLLRPGLSAEDATHMMWLFASFDAFDLLYTGRGLPADEVGRILADAAEAALIG